MKRILLIGLAVFSACIAYTYYNLSFAQAEMPKGPEYDNKRLKDGMSQSFGVEITNLKGTYKSTSSRGSYDGTQYRYTNNNGTLRILYAGPARGIHQNDLLVAIASGQIKQNEGTTSITAKSNFNKFYVFNIDYEYVVDSFSKNVSIAFQTLSLTEAAITPVISSYGSDFDVILLPENVKPKKIYVKEHKPNEIGIFSVLSISDETKTKKYSAGDYVIIGADSFVK